MSHNSVWEKGGKSYLISPSISIMEGVKTCVLLPRGVRRVKIFFFLNPSNIIGHVAFFRTETEIGLFCGNGQ